MKDYKNHLVIQKTTLIDSDGDMYLTVNFLTKINNIVTESDNVTLRKVSVKPDGFAKMYMNKDLIEDNLYQLIHQFYERAIMTKWQSV